MNDNDIEPAEQQLMSLLPKSEPLPYAVPASRSAPRFAWALLSCALGSFAFALLSLAIIMGSNMQNYIDPERTGLWSFGVAVSAILFGIFGFREVVGRIGLALGFLTVVWLIIVIAWN